MQLCHVPLDFNIQYNKCQSIIACCAVLLHEIQQICDNSNSDNSYFQLIQTNFKILAGRIYFQCILKLLNLHRCFSSLHLTQTFCLPPTVPVRDRRVAEVRYIVCGAMRAENSASPTCNLNTAQCGAVPRHNRHSKQ